MESNNTDNTNHTNPEPVITEPNQQTEPQNSFNYMYPFIHFQQPDVAFQSQMFPTQMNPPQMNPPQMNPHQMNQVPMNPAQYHQWMMMNHSFYNQYRFNPQMFVNTQKQEQTTPKRIGHWTDSEEEYSDKIAELFKLGTLPNCPEKTTLRLLLSQLLNCPPMRISKKFTGERAIGKNSYHPSKKNEDLSAEKKELEVLEQKFHESVVGKGILTCSLFNIGGTPNPKGKSKK